ncbi:MAG TPA: hypothetical protein VIV09_16795 [Pseudolabrys sp.]
MLQSTDRERLRRAVEHDIDLVLAACLPTDRQFADNIVEPAMANHCLHPIASLKMSGVMDRTPTIYCSICSYTLTDTAVTLRVEAYKQEVLRNKNEGVQ